MANSLLLSVLKGVLSLFCGKSLPLTFLFHKLFNYKIKKVLHHTWLLEKHET